MWNKLSMKDRAKLMKMAVESGLTDLSKIREVYNNHINRFAEGGEADINNITYDPENIYREAAEYASSYIGSEGFNKRLNAHNDTYYPLREADIEYYNKAGENSFVKKEWPTLEEYLKDQRPEDAVNYSLDENISIPTLEVGARNRALKDNAMYDPFTNSISYGFKPTHNPLMTFGHELGHWIDTNMKNKGKRIFYDYSASYPIFLKSKAYTNVKSSLEKGEIPSFDLPEGNKPLTPEEILAYIQTNYNGPLGQVYSIYHDAYPKESYADLMLYRHLLNKLGVYDSRGTEEFTGEHYDKFLEEFGKQEGFDNLGIRLLDNFDKDTTIEMMNTVAYNPNNQEDRLGIQGIMAAYGGKINKFDGSDKSQMERPSALGLQNLIGSIKKDVDAQTRDNAQAHMDTQRRVRTTERTDNIETPIDYTTETQGYLNKVEQQTVQQIEDQKVYDAWADDFHRKTANMSEREVINYVNRQKNDERIAKANHWEGIMNLISPGQWFGAAVNSENPSDYWANLWYGNSGWVTPEVARNNPRLALAANFLEDAIIGGVGYKGYKGGKQLYTESVRPSLRQAKRNVRDYIIANRLNKENVSANLDFRSPNGFNYRDFEDVLRANQPTIPQTPESIALNEAAIDFYNRVIFPRFNEQVWNKAYDTYSMPLFRELPLKPNKPIEIADITSFTDRPNIAGLHYNKSGRNIIDKKYADNVSYAIHEAVSHGTDDFVPNNQQVFYNYTLDLLDKNNFSVAESANWQELRATKTQMIKYLEDNNLNIDNLSDAELVDILGNKINGYGRDYANALKKAQTYVSEGFNLSKGDTPNVVYKGTERTHSFSSSKPTKEIDFGIGKVKGTDNEFLNRLRFMIKYLPAVGGTIVGLGALNDRKSLED